ncbi:hypothetical protein EON65_11390 [archaeon]|nr:MAG: hypothetical protein EON65_11390 [archaeon]
MAVYYDLPYEIYTPNLREEDFSPHWAVLDCISPSVEHACFDRLGLYLACFHAGGSIQLIDASSHNLAPQSFIQVPYMDRIIWSCLSLCWSHDARHLIASCVDKKAKYHSFLFVWDVASLTLVHAYQ